MIGGHDVITGKAHRLGDNVNTDDIIPATHLVDTELEILAEHLFKSFDPEFKMRISPGDVIVAGENFGSGSSREHAPLAIKGAGIACVIASSFARIFYRNAINVGLPVIESPEAAAGIEDGDLVRIDLEAGIIENKTYGTSFSVPQYPEFMVEIIEAGGLIDFIMRKEAQ